MVERTLPTYCIRLRKLREDCKLTQEQVAQRMRISRNSLSDYELGERKIPLTKLQELAHIYHTTLDYICGLDYRHTLVLDDLDEETVEKIMYIVSKSYQKNSD